MARKRSINAAVGILLGLALTTACSGSGGFEADSAADPDSGATGTVRMLVNVTPNLTKGYWRELVAPFEKANPGIKVQIDSPTAADGSVDSTLQQLLAAGNAPDVVEGSHNDKVLPYLRDLSDLSWAADAPMADAQRLDGQLYDVAIGQQVQSLVFYNKKAFEKAGIAKPPTTMRELTAAMRKLKSAGYLPMQTAGEWVTQAQVMMLFAPTVTTGEPDWFKQASDGRRSLTTDLGPAMNLYKDWLDKGYLDKQALGTKYPEAETEFLSGKAAMYPMGCWFVAAEAQAKKDFEVGVFPSPQLNDPSAPRLSVTPGANYRIFKAGKHQKASEKLVQFLTTDRAAVAGQLKQDSSFRTGYPYKLSPLADEVQALLDRSTSHQAIVGSGEYQMPAGFETEQNKQVQSLYTGGDAADGLKNVDTWLKAHTK
ncbi:extracellular solute-binding protein [Streptomyces sp. SID5914]|nr:extracellular solute-binding protein [Streptomyces sp. SID5914]MZG15145.1 extracellular solute-binding protein [Streptomyces sp. SID5914]